MRAKELVHKLLGIIAEHGDPEVGFVDYDNYEYEVKSVFAQTGVDGDTYVTLSPRNV